MNLHFPNKQQSDEGFTLLEVLIAMAILVFLSFAIYQATTETYKLREVLSTEGDFYNEIRLSMNVVQRDISQIFSPTQMVPEKKTPSPSQPEQPNRAGGEQRELDTILTSDLGQTTQYWAGATDKTAIRPSRFIGTDSKMSFISTSHIRIYKDAPESELAKVSYELKSDPQPVVANTYILIKSTSPNTFETDDMRDKMFAHYPLLHGIKKLAYRYYRKEKDQWSSSWDSDKEETKNLYPDMIEIKMEVVGPSKLTFEGIFLFRPEAPLYGITPSS